MGVKCLAQEHNTVPRPGLEPGTSNPESSRACEGMTFISRTINVVNPKFVAVNTRSELEACRVIRVSSVGQKEGCHLPYLSISLSVPYISVC